MPLKKQSFSIVQDNMSEAIDIDDSRGRSVPVNMNFIETGYLTKDTGYSVFGATETLQPHSLFNFEKKNGTSYFMRVLGTYLQKYNTTTNLWENIVWGGTATITIATPGVITKTAHKFGVDSQVVFSTTGALPTGIVAGTTYYVISTVLATDSFQISATKGGSAIATSGSQSGVHTVQKIFTANAQFGYKVDSAGDILYACNAVDSMFTWDGTTFTDYSSAPKGNILEIFEDKLYVAGVTAEPRTVYYSNSGVLSTFTGTDVFKPLGTDKITGLVNYYGFLLVFKEKSIWKVTRVQDNIGTYYNKQELQSGNYGACSRKAIVWVENDIWFYTGREVRAFGFKDQQTGVLGINTSVLSEAIKETLNNVNESNFPYTSCYYNNRKFYLSISLSSVTPTINDTIFVCHTLYKNSWTKYTSRDKAKALELYSIRDTIYSVKNVTPFSVLKWDTSLLNDNGSAITSSVTFKKIEDKDFNLFNIYRYLDLMFKNLQAKVEVTIYQDKSDIRTSKIKTFYIGLGTEDELATVGEVDFGENLWADGFGQSPQSSPFLKRRISFLSKAQSLTIQLTNSGLNEAFTIVQFAVNGFKEEKKTFTPSSIVSVR